MSKFTPLEKGIHESQQSLWSPYDPLKVLIENNQVEQDDNGDWVMICYHWGYTNSKEHFHYMETGYLTDWTIYKWKHDVDQNERHTSYRTEAKDCIPREYLTIVNENHRYSKDLYEDDDFWTEGIESIKNSSRLPLYYKDSLGNKNGKIPVKIGKKIQEIKDKGIISGFYK